MFNLTLFLLLTLISIPGILSILSGSLDATEQLVEDNLKPGQAMPSRATLLIVSFLQSLVLLAIAAAAGTALAARSGLSAPFFESLAAGSPDLAGLSAQLSATLIWGLAGVVPFLLIYYLFVRPRFDQPSLAILEGLRMRLGLASRILYGGIYEEVLTRWGLMVLFAWPLTALFGQTTLAIWLAILLSGLLFGLGHMPTYLAAGCKRTPIFVFSVIFLNLWASLFFGYLFWQHGLAAAMMAHMLFHLVWYPFDLYFTRGQRQGGRAADDPELGGVLVDSL
jgi:hypothetical protein